MLFRRFDTLHWLYPADGLDHGLLTYQLVMCSFGGPMATTGSRD